MLEVRHVTKRYRRTAVVVDVSFDLDAGVVTGYLGPNGSGKSTTVKMLAGLVEPTSGDIRYHGVDVRRDPIGFKRRIGYVPEEAHVYPTLSAQEYLELTGRVRGMPEAEGDVARLRRLMQLPSLEAIFAQLVEHEDLEAVAREIADAVVSDATGVGR